MPQLTFDGSHIWLATDNGSHGGELLRISLDGQTKDDYGSVSDANALTFDGRLLWIVDSSGTRSISPATHNTVDVIDRGTVAKAPLLCDGWHLWLGYPDSGYLTRINR